MIVHVDFTDKEMEHIGRYASEHSMEMFDVIRKATLSMIEDWMDIRAFERAMEGFGRDQIAYPLEDVGGGTGIHLIS